MVHRLHAPAAAGDRGLGRKPGQHPDAPRLRRHPLRADLGSLHVRGRQGRTEDEAGAWAPGGRHARRRGSGTNGETPRSQKPRPKRRLNADGSAAASDSPDSLDGQAAPAGTNSGNMVRVRICMESMELATKNCPDVPLAGVHERHAAAALLLAARPGPGAASPPPAPAPPGHAEQPDAATTAPAETTAASGGSNPLAGRTARLPRRPPPRSSRV